VSGKPSNSKQPAEGLGKRRQKAFDSFQDALVSPLGSSKVTTQHEEQVNLDFENEKLSLDNRLEKRKSRRQWNKVLRWLVISGFILSYLLIILIGLGVLDFDDHAFAVPSVVAAGIVETYGLAKLAIKYFFSEDGETVQQRK
jgi:hypothetical protein